MVKWDRVLPRHRRLGHRMVSAILGLNCRRRFVARRLRFAALAEPVFRINKPFAGSRSTQPRRAASLAMRSSPQLDSEPLGSGPPSVSPAAQAHSPYQAHERHHPSSRPPLLGTARTTGSTLRPAERRAPQFRSLLGRISGRVRARREAKTGPRLGFIDVRCPLPHPANQDHRGNRERNSPPAAHRRGASLQIDGFSWVTRHEIWPGFVVRESVGASHQSAIASRRSAPAYASLLTDHGAARSPRRAYRHVIRYRRGTTAKSGLLLSLSSLAATPRTGRVSATRRVNHWRCGAAEDAHDSSRKERVSSGIA